MAGRQVDADWRLRGRDADLLVDTGMGIASLRQAVANLFDKTLLAVANPRPRRPCGGLHEFDCRLCHEAEAEALTQGRDSYSLDLMDFSAEARAGLAQAGYDISSGLLTDDSFGAERLATIARAHLLRTSRSEDQTLS